MQCPKCGSNHVITNVVTDEITTTKSKGFGICKAICGYIIFNIPGILCGLCGMGKEKHTKTTRTRKVSTCQDCGHQF